MALTLYKSHNEIIDKLKKLSPADSDDWILRFHDAPSKKEKKKTCVACVAKKPDNCGEIFPASGTFVLFLEKSDYKICKFEKRNATFPGISDIDFKGKSFQELCKRNEWPTIDVILETACRVEQTSAELTFSLNGLSIYAKVSTLSSLGSNEPIQLFCEVLKVCTDTHPPVAPAISRTVSLMDSTQHQQHASTSGIITSSSDMNENNKFKPYPQLNRTISVPCDGNSVNPTRISSNCFLSSPPPQKPQMSKPIGSQKRKEKRLDSIIDSVATNSTIEMFSSPPLPSSTEIPSMMGPLHQPSTNPRGKPSMSTTMVEEKGSVLKSLLQNPSSAGTLGLPPGYQMQTMPSSSSSGNNYGYVIPTQQLTLRQNSYDAGTMLSAESTGFEIANFGVFSPKETTAKKKRQRAPAGTKKLTKKQQKDLGIQQRQQQQAQQHPSDMFQTAGYPQPPAQNGFPTGGHAGMTQQQYAQAQQQHMIMQQRQQQAAAAAQQQHQQQQAMFNPNMPSSSRAGQMSSSAMMQQQMNHHQGLGHPMNMYPNGAQMTPQQQMQMQQSQNNMMQHGNPAGWNGMYHQQQQQHPNMFPYAQQQGRQFMPPQAQPQQQQPPAPAAPKKTTKRKNAKANQEQQQQQAAIAMHAQQAATSQQHQPPNKQPFLNPMNSMYSGSPQFSSPSTPMNHVSPFHPQHAAAAAAQQQQQQHFEWAKNAGMNRPNSQSEQVRADLRATIQTRQNTSPPQMGAIMSPNEQHPARFTGPNSSSSPMTMMSPPRVSQGPHPGHASASSYGPGSIPQPSSAASEHQTNLFSPKQQNGFYNNYPNGMQQQPQQQQHPNPQSINSQQHQQSMTATQMQVHQQQQHQQHHQQQQQHHQQMHHQHQQQMQVLEELKAFPSVSLDDCKEILQEDGYGDLDVIGFDMMTKQGFEFNYDESRALLQRILY